MLNPLHMASLKSHLGIDRLALQIHDVSFPSEPEEDCGRGTPYSRGAERLFAFAARLGFDTIQLGPQGMTQRGNASPYDGTLFSRNPLNLPLARLVEEGRLSRVTFDGIRIGSATGPSQRPPYSVIFDHFQHAIAEVISRADATDRNTAREYVAANESWLISDALYGMLCQEHDAPWWGTWNRTEQGAFDQRLYHPAAGNEAAAAKRLSALRSQYAQQIEDYALIQLLLQREHQALRLRLASLKLSIFADLQVGLSPQEMWARQGLFLESYRMGAPPSRTNPAGQPWGYSVFDPHQIGTLEAPGPALRFVQGRLRNVIANYDGLRIDHPHGWVDPWVYRADDSDPFHAVQHGARLFSSPEEPDHPQLQAFAIARAAQIDRSQPRHGDHRVQSLEDEQVARYARLVDAIVAGSQALGRAVDTMACEVLSTLPYPIQRVLQRGNLGRFRVTQKANLDDPGDVYRIENAQPEDWIMLGTHDTATIWELAQRWCQSPVGTQWGRYLSTLLEPASADRGPLEQQIASSPGELIHALFTAMVSCQARHIAIFFPDLFGLIDRYNEPGVVAEENWRLRLPTDFEQQYAERCRRGEALEITRCFEQATQRSVNHWGE